MALLWLLDLSLGGRTLRVSTRPTSFGGRRYTGTVDEVSMTETLALGSAPSAREASVDLLPEINIAELVSQGHTLTAGKATLRLWDDDDAEYLAEIVMLNARCSTPEFAGANEPLSFELSSEPFDDIASLIPETAAISAQTWSGAPNDSLGIPYERPFGTPGLVEGISTSNVPAGRAYAVTSYEGESYLAVSLAASSTLLMASAQGELIDYMEVVYADNGGGGWGLTDGATYYVENTGTNTYRIYEEQELITHILIAAGTPPNGAESFTISQPYARLMLVPGEVDLSVYFEDPNGDVFDSASYSVTLGVDGLGRPVRTIDVSAWGVDATSSDAIKSRLKPAFVGWTAASVTTLNGTLGVGGLLADLGKLASVPVDVGSFLVAADDLAMPIGLVLVEDERPTDLLLRIARVLPIGFYTGIKGLTAIRLPTSPDRRTAIDLTDGINCHRASSLGIVNESDDQVTSVAVKYAPNVHTEQEVGKVTLAADPTHPFYLEAATAASDVYIRSSAIAQDEDVEKSLVETLDWTYGSAAAKLAARWVSKQASVSPRTLSVDVEQTLARKLQLGQAVSLTSTDLSITTALGFVSEREMSSGELWRLQIYFLHGVASSQTDAPTGASSTPPSPVVGT